MSADERPDVKELRRKLTILVAVIVTALVTLVGTTFYLYAKYSAAGRITP